MNKVIAVARREMQERAFVFVTAIGITLAPLLALAVPRGTFDERLSAFAILSLLCACNFTIGLSAILGASLVGRELTEKRMSFYFSRPLSASSIWLELPTRSASGGYETLALPVPRAPTRSRRSNPVAWPASTTSRRWWWRIRSRATRSARRSPTCRSHRCRRRCPSR